MDNNLVISRDVLRDAQDKVLGKRFCAHCQSMQPLPGGEWVTTKVKRWKCARCYNKQLVRNAEKQLAAKKED